MCLCLAFLCNNLTTVRNYELQFQVPSSNVGQGSQCHSVGLSHYVGPSAIPRKFPAILVLKVTAGIAKSTTTPAHMTTSPVRSHRPNQAITHPFTVMLTKRLYSPHRKPPGKTAQPEQETSYTSRAATPRHRAKRGTGEPTQGFQARQENRSPELQCAQYLLEIPVWPIIPARVSPTSDRLQDTAGTVKPPSTHDQNRWATTKQSPVGICKIPMNPSKAWSQNSTLSWLRDQPSFELLLFHGMTSMHHP